MPTECEVSVQVTIGERYGSNNSRGQYTLILQDERLLQFVIPESLLPFTTEIIRQTLADWLARQEEPKDVE